ncbi:MAG: pilus assembly protein CpaD [Caulobacter sp.]|nr:pilus assembly protein CpaD [Caulobacter sp.]
MNTMTRTGRIALLIPTLACAGVLSACATDGAKPDKFVARTPSEQWTDQVKVAAAPDEVRLAPHRTGLSPNQGGVLGALMGRWIEADGGEIVVRAPTGGGDPAAIYAVATQSRDFLVANGAAPNAVIIAGYDSKGDPAAPVIVGYIRFQAEIPECGKTWGNVTSTSANKPFGNFGCAVTANIAAQVANPADLDHPRTMTPGDASRRATVLDHYRKGENTSSAKDASASGAVSKAVD